MRAAIEREGAVAVADVAEPSPADGEVLVRVASAGVNSADLQQVAGNYPPPAGASEILGLELAGERVDTGERVMAIVAGGGQAQLAAVPEAQLMPVPDNVALDLAGAFPEAFTTAHDALVTQCGLARGERLVVHGAAGGVGTAAVQIGRALGARVIATVRDEAAREPVMRLGAETVIDPEEFQHSAATLQADVILELVGAPNFAADLEALAPRGRVAIIGLGGGAKAEINLARMLAKRLVVRGSTLRRRSPQEKADAVSAVRRDLLGMLGSGELEIPLAASFGLEQASAAYERFAAGRKLGKIVLTT